MYIISFFTISFQKILITGEKGVHFLTSLSDYVPEPTKSAAWAICLLCSPWPSRGSSQGIFFSINSKCLGILSSKRR